MIRDRSIDIIYDARIQFWHLGMKFDTFKWLRSLLHKHFNKTRNCIKYFPLRLLKDDGPSFVTFCNVIIKQAPVGNEEVISRIQNVVQLVHHLVNTTNQVIVLRTEVSFQ